MLILSANEFGCATNMRISENKNMNVIVLVPQTDPQERLRMTQKIRKNIKNIFKVIDYDS